MGESKHIRSGVKMFGLFVKYAIGANDATKFTFIFFYNALLTFLPTRLLVSSFLL
jgi:hypothetical protein